jgi:hypothetical protein
MSAPGAEFFEAIMAEDALNSATRSLKQDYWMKGCKYRPSDQHLAKLRCRFALFIRLLQAEPGTADRALRHIEGAVRLQPGGAAIVKEKDNIMAWKARGYYSLYRFGMYWSSSSHGSAIPSSLGCKIQDIVANHLRLHRLKNSEIHNRIGIQSYL